MAPTSGRVQEERLVGMMENWHLFDIFIIALSCVLALLHLMANDAGYLEGGLYLWHVANFG